MDSSRDILIVGASGRAAADSARRAGLRPWVVDLFGDEDLAELAHEYHVIRDYKELPAAIDDWPMMPWLGTGAIENHPGLIERFSLDRPYLGSPINAIKAVRAPRVLSETLKQAGRPLLEIWPEPTPPPPDGRWMLKPLQSGGGQGVFIWNEKASESQAAALTLKRPHYFQRRVDGEAISAVFLSGDAETTLIGISRLLPANNPELPFGYGGTIGPASFPSELEFQIERTGRLVGGAFGLRGLWGTDFILDGNQAFATEVNPRYTASVEIYEYAFDNALLGFHCEAFRTADHEFLRPQADRLKPPIIGKVVIYADRDLVVPAWNNWAKRRDLFLADLPVLADRPWAGSRALKGHPICSLLAAAESEQGCLQKLNSHIAEWLDHFQRSGIEIATSLLGEPRHFG